MGKRSGDRASNDRLPAQGSKDKRGKPVVSRPNQICCGCDTGCLGRGKRRHHPGGGSSDRKISKATPHCSQTSARPETQAPSPNPGFRLVFVFQLKRRHDNAGNMPNSPGNPSSAGLVVNGQVKASATQVLWCSSLLCFVSPQ